MRIPKDVLAGLQTAVGMITSGDEADAGCDMETPEGRQAWREIQSAQAWLREQIRKQRERAPTTGGTP